MPHNPWIDQHLTGEMEYTGDGYTRRQAAAIVRGEYAGREGSEPCGSCGAPAFYRATVGAVQCPSCRALKVTHFVDKVTGKSYGCSVAGHLRDTVRLETRWI